MTYRVRIVPLPAVVDADGRPLVDAHVLEIVFPGETIDTPAGRLNVVSGAGFAKIIVHGGMIWGVPLC